MPITTDTDTTPYHLQHQSPLFRLPPELRLQIYRLSLTSPTTIVNPHLPSQTSTPTPPNKTTYIPLLGTPLLQTCLRAHSEIPASFLLTENHFRFPTLTDAHDFIRSLGPDRAKLIRDMELDLFSSQYKTTARREWSHYLAWLAENGVWARNLVQLQADVPGLQCLRLDVGRDVIWSFLEGILRGPKNLQRIVVTGQSQPACCAAWESSERWAWDLCRPMDFLGKPRSEPHVVDLMLGCVVGEDKGKVIGWRREGRRVTLDVLGEKYATTIAEGRGLLKGLLGSFDEERCRLPSRGACRYEDYNLRREWRIDLG